MSKKFKTSYHADAVIKKAIERGSRRNKSVYKEYKLNVIWFIIGLVFSMAIGLSPLVYIIFC